MSQTMPRTKVFPKTLTPISAARVDGDLAAAAGYLEEASEVLTRAFGPNNRMATGAAGLAMACDRLREKAAGFVEKPLDKTDPSDIV